MIYSSSKPVVD